MNNKKAKKLRKYTRKEFQAFIDYLERPKFLPKFIFKYFIKIILEHNTKI